MLVRVPFPWRTRYKSELSFPDTLLHDQQLLTTGPLLPAHPAMAAHSLEPCMLPIEKQFSMYIFALLPALPPKIPAACLPPAITLPLLPRLRMVTSPLTWLAPPTKATHSPVPLIEQVSSRIIFSITTPTPTYPMNPTKLPVTSILRLLMLYPCPSK